MNTKMRTTGIAYVENKSIIITSICGKQFLHHDASLCLLTIYLVDYREYIVL